MTHAPRSFHWTVAAIIFGGFAMGLILVWQLWGLTPGRWCVVAINAAKMTNMRPTAEDCTTIILRLLDLKDHAIVGLLGVIGLSFLVMVVTLFKAKISFSGPGGVGGSVGGGEMDITGTIDATVTPKEEK